MEINIDSLSEALFWFSIKDTTWPEELEIYIENYPNGKFASLARARINRLRGLRPEQTTLKSLSI